MTRKFHSAAPSGFATFTGSVNRVLLLIVMSAGLAACAGAPSKPETPQAVIKHHDVSAFKDAASMYNAGDYEGALYAFNKIGKDPAESANDRRLAQLGKALVYLGNDQKLHSVANAKLALVSAGQVQAGAGEEFAVETNMLMEAVSFVIGTESKYDVLKEKSGGSNAQVAQLRKENEALQSERDDLLAEQKSLKEALEKLKKLTLGN